MLEAGQLADTDEVRDWLTDWLTDGGEELNSFYFELCQSGDFRSLDSLLSAREDCEGSNTVDKSEAREDKSSPGPEAGRCPVSFYGDDWEGV